MNFKKYFIISAFLALLILCTATLILSQGVENYNRPDPLMDYVSQEFAMYDTTYPELNESDCRCCHGNNLADRHYPGDRGTVTQDCEVCHELTAEPPGVVLINDCTTSGCHQWPEDVSNGWHHNTDMSLNNNCSSCHDSGAIDDYSPLRDILLYPPPILSPSPFTCENCHYQQNLSGTHPNTTDHTDCQGTTVPGTHEYGIPIMGNRTNHHMGESNVGNVYSDCEKCHPLDINGDVDTTNPNNPLLIRYCMKCHTIASLHTISSHVQSGIGWEAVGFHAYNSSNPEYSNPADLEPVNYITFYQDETCYGCHSEGVGDPTPATEDIPSIENTSNGIQPTHGSLGTRVTIRGEYFGDTNNTGYDVEISSTGGSGPWSAIPSIYLWSDTLIMFEASYLSMEAGINYLVRIKTPTGESNQVNFTVEAHPGTTSLYPQSGNCGEWITIQGSGFGEHRTEMFDTAYGRCYVVDFVCSANIYTALTYCNDITWTNSEIQVRFYDFFIDLKDVNGQRNYIQDDGSQMCGTNEPTLFGCEEMYQSIYAVYVTVVYFKDNDGDSELSCGDTIDRTTNTNPLNFTLSAQPTIYQLNPGKILTGNLLKIIGVNLGNYAGDGSVFIGNESQANNPLLNQGDTVGSIKNWSNTRIRVYSDAIPMSWQGQTGFIWIEKGGFKSNFQKIIIMPD